MRKYSPPLYLGVFDTGSGVKDLVLVFYVSNYIAVLVCV